MANYSVKQLNFTKDGNTYTITGETYESKQAASGGTAVSLVTTGEKYDWTVKANQTAATTSANGLMSAADKTKLDGIATGATANTGTITGITMNGASKGTSGVVDLGTVITGHPGVTAGKFLQTDSNGDAVWGDGASSSTVATATTNWLAANVPTGTTVVIDKSLSIDSAAADAKKTGEVKTAAFSTNGPFTDLEAYWISGAYIGISGTTADLYNPTADVNYLYQYGECKPGDVFIYTGKARGYAFLSSMNGTNNIIDKAQSNTFYDHVMLTAPEGTKYYTFIAHKTSNPHGLLKLNDTNDIINDATYSLCEHNDSLWIRCAMNVNSGALTNSTTRLTSLIFTADQYEYVTGINGYEIGIYVYRKDGSFVGILKGDGTISTGTTNFQWGLFFKFSDYPDYRFRLLVRNRAAASSTITISESSNILFFKNRAKVLEKTAIEEIEIQTESQYIETGISDLTQGVHMTPVSLANFGYAMVPCKAGDKFTVSGVCGFAARLWAFLDIDRKIITRSENGGYSINEKLVAPENAVSLVVNFNLNYGHSLCRGHIELVPKDFTVELISQADVQNMPNGIVKPTIGYQAAIGGNNNLKYKATVFKNGNAYCITYNENIDGGTTDFPEVTESGVLAMNYKFFTLSGSTESNVSYGEIAKKGTTYKTWDGGTDAFVGGCGLPCGVGNLQYFTSAYTGTHSYNNRSNYGMTPCCCTVTVSNSGVTFGQIQELSLSVNGVNGKFDISRIPNAGENYFIYYTTTPPRVDSNGLYHWMQPVKNGFAYFTSENGVNWTFKYVVNTPYQPQPEVCCVPVSDDQIIFAARTRNDVGTRHRNIYTYIGILESENGMIRSQVKLPCITSRAFLTKDDDGYLLFYNAADYREVVCLRIVIERNNLVFRKWFSLYHSSTCYTNVNQELTGDYTQMYLVGTDGRIGTRVGTSFTILNFAASPRTYYEMSASVE